MINPTYLPFSRSIRKSLMSGQGENVVSRSHWNTKQPPIGRPPAHTWVSESSTHEGHFSNSATITTEKKIMCLNKMKECIWPWQCSTSLQRHCMCFSLYGEFMQGGDRSVGCPSCKWHPSVWERNKFSSFTRTAEMGSSINHIRWRERTFCWHSWNQEKKKQLPSTLGSFVSHFQFSCLQSWWILLSHRTDGQRRYTQPGYIQLYKYTEYTRGPWFTRFKLNIIKAAPCGDWMEWSEVVLLSISVKFHRNDIK